MWIVGLSRFVFVFVLRSLLLNEPKLQPDEEGLDARALGGPVLGAGGAQEEQEGGTLQVCLSTSLNTHSTHVFIFWVILAYTCVKPVVRLYVCQRVHFGSILGPFWVHSGSILGPFWVHSGSILGPFWVHFGSILGPFWVHFGSILGPFWVHFGSILGPIWVQFWVHFGSI